MAGAKGGREGESSLREKGTRTLSKQDFGAQKWLNGSPARTMGSGGPQAKKNAPMSPTDRPRVEPYPGLLTAPCAKGVGHPCLSAMRAGESRVGLVCGIRSLS